MKIIDISWPISNATTGYKDKKIFEIESLRSFDRDEVRETAIKLNSHTGTHVDAPSHFLKDGISVDLLPLKKLIGSAIVLDLTDVSEKITRDDLAEREAEIRANDIVLLKTVNSDKNATDKFTPHFIFLEQSGAQFLKEKKISAVGIDYLGIERSQPNHETHRLLMETGIIIIEGLRLQAVNAGRYNFVCLPLYVIGTEAAPARAVLLEP